MIDQEFPLPAFNTSAYIEKRLARRYRREWLFRTFGRCAVLLAIFFLLTLLFSIFLQGHRAFSQHYVNLSVEFKRPSAVSSEDGMAASSSHYRSLLKEALWDVFPHIQKRSEKRALSALFTSNADLDLRDMVLADPSLIGQRRTVSLSLSALADLALKDREILSSIGETKGSLLLVLLGEKNIGLESDSGDFLPILEDLKRFWQKKLLGQEEETSLLRSRMSRVFQGLLLSQERFAAAQKDGGQVPYTKKYSMLMREIARKHREMRIVAWDLANANIALQSLRERIAEEAIWKNLIPEMPSYFVRVNGGIVKLISLSAHKAEGKVLFPLDSMQASLPGSWSIAKEELPESKRKISDMQLGWLRILLDGGMLEKRLSTALFTAGASREAERAGILGALLGSLYTLLVMLALAFPIGVATAIYLEEFAPENRWTNWVEVNVANLAAVPSIVFGLLGLAFFLNIFGIPRSIPVSGGMVLALATLPTIIISSRAALSSVPSTIKQGALALGASHLQSVFHHVVPSAFPGILTGTIIGVAQVLGETAPLLMIGMVAFVADIPKGFSDVATVLPVQIYMWSDFPEPAFREKAAAAILILLGFLILMNLFAVFLRYRLRVRW